MSAPKVPPVPEHLQGEIDGMPKAIPYTRARFGKETELKKGVPYDPNERGGGAGYSKAKGKGKGSRAEQLEELRDAPSWAQPGKRPKMVEAPTQEDMLYYLMNQDPRTISKFTQGFGTKAAGNAMASQQTGFEGMPTGASYAPDETMGGTYDDPALLQLIQTELESQGASPAVDAANIKQQATGQAAPGASGGNPIADFIARMLSR